MLYLSVFVYRKYTKIISIRIPMEAFKMLFLCSFLFSMLGMSSTLETISPKLSMRDGESETLVSAGGSFELGFFNPGNSKGRYLGIWYKNISTRTVVWVANREIPLNDSSGVLTITDKGILLLLNGTNGTVWSSNTSTTAHNPVGQLLDSGNLVVREGGNENPESFLWQSFDYPCDTLLPGMKLGRNFKTGLNRFLSSWKSADDPAQGGYAFWIDPRGYSQVVLTKGPVIYYRVGSWDGTSFTGISWLRYNKEHRSEFVLNENEVYYKYEMLNGSYVTRFGLSVSGAVQVNVWSDRNDWQIYVTAPVDQCDTYSLCGPYSNCFINQYPKCVCLEGFIPKSLKESEGCIRRTALACGNGTDGFQKYSKVKLPDTSSSWFNSTMSLKECEGQCLKNCSCVAYANSDVRGEGSGCLLWFDNLIDIREVTDSLQDIYIRVASSELDRIGKKRHSIERRRAGIIASSVVLGTGMAILGLAFCIRKKILGKKGNRKAGQRKDYITEKGNEDLELPIFDLPTIANATDNFSSNNKLGQGGFGPVYKGTLMEGQEIAVKRLSKNSGQGVKEFKNEVILIAKLQHRNLVKLLGCCIEGDEKLLIYEFMPNKSLDFFIFDQKSSKLLDWNKRINIIGGIARGLLYLHQDSRLRIIHRDLKTSNILLDKDMNPKISDFGMARTFWGDQTEENTRRVVGTYGYMSPEYQIDGLFSVKSDVFSFGVIVLEMVSGRKNRGFYHQGHNLNLLGHAWRLWIEEKPLELLDSMLSDSFSLSEVLRCIHVGLLCVQQQPEDRPNMSIVVLMLGSDGILPSPKQLGFYIERSPQPIAGSSSSMNESCSINEISFTVLEAR